jgi:hypothetical protein
MGPDPIFLAIEAHQMAHSNYAQALVALECGPARPDRSEVMDRLRAGAADAAWALLEIGPTTEAGVLALASYAGDFVVAGNEWPEGWDLRLYSAIVRAAERRRRTPD